MRLAGFSVFGFSVHRTKEGCYATVGVACHAAGAGAGTMCFWPEGVVMMSQRPRAVFGVCLAVAVALVAPTAAAAAPPATLTGEEFLHGGVPSPACETPGTVSYTASGTATGPYSGTFTETGTAAGTVFPN